MKFLFYSLTCSVDIYFYLFFCDVKHIGNILISFSFKIAKLHATSLFFRKFVYDFLHHAHSVFVDYVLVRVVSAIWSISPGAIKLTVLIVVSLYTVKR